MKKMLIMGLLAGVMFGGSAGVSWYLRKMKEEQAAAPGETSPQATFSPSNRQNSGNSVAANANSTPAVSPLRPVVPPPFNPEADGTVQLAANLSRQLEAVRNREQHLNTRQKQLDLIYQDVRNERTVLDGMRKQVAEEAAALEKSLSAIEQKFQDLQQQRESTKDQLNNMKRQTTEFDVLESERIRQLATMVEGMPPENAAKLLQHMADSGSLDTAVKILAGMKERSAAKVLAEIPDPSIATQLFDKLRGLKKPGPPPSSSSTTSKPPVKW
jgi:flagellar motility protein MotE (MotC chaperone)